jgi:histone H3/H4
VKRLFFDPKRYDLTRVGRYKINQKLASKVDPDARIQAQLLDRLEQIMQEYMAELVSSTVLTAGNQKRKTMMVKDLDFIIKIRGPKNDTSSFTNSSQPTATSAVTSAASN